jgi:hypothetical protein
MVIEMSKPTRSLLLMLCVLIGRVAMAQALALSCDGPSPLSRPVRSLHLEASNAIQAILQIGQAYRVCFGIEYVGNDLMSRGVNADISSGTVADALKAILPVDHGYVVAERDGVVEISNPTHLPKARSTFETKIERFRMRRGPVQEISNGLRMQLAAQVDPSVKGFAGSYRTGDLEDIVGPFDERDKAVSEMLDKVVRQSRRGATWLAQFSPAVLKPNLPWQIWTIIEYDRPVQDYFSLLQSVRPEEPLDP